MTCNETVQSDGSSILSNLIEAVAGVVESEIETDLSFTCDKSGTSRNCRTRTRQEKLWADNKRRKARNTGQEYTTRKEKVHRAKALGQGCGDKSRLRCHDKISDSSRELIFHSFWKLGDINQERSFINERVREKEKKVSKVGQSRRTRTFQWTFQLHGETHVVCKTFFLSALDISYRFVSTALSKRSACSTTSPEKRGKHSNRPHKVDEERDAIKGHINRFPRVESHCCRKSTYRQYLGAQLSISKLYDLYVQERKQEGIKPASKTVRKDFNLGFHVPLKDRCDFVLFSRYLQKKKKTV